MTQQMKMNPKKKMTSVEKTDKKCSQPVCSSLLLNNGIKVIHANQGGIFMGNLGIGIRFPQNVLAQAKFLVGLKKMPKHKKVSSFD